jgi:hypothetical protein
MKEQGLDRRDYKRMLEEIALFVREHDGFVSRDKLREDELQLPMLVIKVDDVGPRCVDWQCLDWLAREALEQEDQRQEEERQERKYNEWRWGDEEQEEVPRSNRSIPFGGFISDNSFVQRFVKTTERAAVVATPAYCCGKGPHTSAAAEDFKGRKSKRVHCALEDARLMVDDIRRRLGWRTPGTSD